MTMKFAEKAMLGFGALTLFSVGVLWAALTF